MLSVVLIKRIRGITHTLLLTTTVARTWSQTQKGGNVAVSMETYANKQTVDGRRALYAFGRTWTSPTATPFIDYKGIVPLWH